MNATCIECSLEKPVKEFYENRTAPNRVTARCRECTDNIKAGLTRTITGVYVLHFDSPVNYADAFKYGDSTGRHYIGSSSDIQWRIWNHRQGEGSGMTKAALKQGIGFKLAGVFPGYAVEMEMALIRAGAKNICTHCLTENDEMLKAHIWHKENGVKWDKDKWLEQRRSGEGHQ